MLDLWQVDQGLLERMVVQDIWLMWCRQVGNRRKHMACLFEAPSDFSCLRTAARQQEPASWVQLASILSGGLSLAE
jgi:hypothetical protein